MAVNDNIDAIIQHGEELTAELNTKYEGLNLEDLFKSDASVQQWEGEDFRPRVCRPCFALLYVY
jgi:SWI/SNF-related matrix-associated actin-dependent regulator of chromatin subfamily A member 5